MSLMRIYRDLKLKNRTANIRKSKIARLRDVEASVLKSKGSRGVHHCGGEKREPQTIDRDRASHLRKRLEFLEAHNLAIARRTAQKHIPANKCFLRCDKSRRDEKEQTGTCPHCNNLKERKMDDVCVVNNYQMW